MDKDGKPVILKSENNLALRAGAYPYFKNSEIVSELIKKNENVKVVKINGQDPFDFILNFQ